MNALLSQAPFQCYALAVAVLVLNLYGLGFYTAKLRADRKIVLNPEDAGINGGAAVAESEHPDVLRVKRAHLNLLENAVPFFAIGFLYTLTDPSVTLSCAFFTVFVVIRLFHSVFYLTAKQPFRTLSFAVGALINVAMVVQVVRAVVSASSSGY